MALFVRDSIVSRLNINCECVFAEIVMSNNRHIVVGSCYVPPLKDSDIQLISNKRVRNYNAFGQMCIPEFHLRPSRPY